MNALGKNDEEQLKRLRTFSAWKGTFGEAKVHPDRPLGTFFTWLEDERPGFPERRRYSMWEEWHELRFRGRNQQVTEDQKGPPGQGPGEVRSGQAHSNCVRRLSQNHRTRDEGLVF